MVWEFDESFNCMYAADFSMLIYTRKYILLMNWLVS